MSGPGNAGAAKPAFNYAAAAAKSKQQQAQQQQQQGAAAPKADANGLPNGNAAEANGKSAANGAAARAVNVPAGAGARAGEQIGLYGGKNLRAHEFAPLAAPSGVQFGSDANLSSSPAQPPTTAHQGKPAAFGSVDASSAASTAPRASRTHPSAPQG